VLGSIFLALLIGLAPARAQTQQPNYVESEVEFVSSDQIKLLGTLTLPNPVEKPVPVVLFIHGSGPQDRNESPMRLFNTLARQLALKSVASLRYDKRGIGQSRGDFLKASFTDLVNDAKAALQFLNTFKEINTKKLFPVGHSEGGYIVAELAAAELVSGGIVSLAGPAQSLDAIYLWQIEAINRASGANESIVQASLNFNRAFIAFAKQSQGEWENYTLQQLQSFMPGITQQVFDSLRQSGALAWWREHFNRNALDVLKRVKTPTLVLQGNKDLQVPWDEAVLWAQELNKAGNTDTQVHMLADLNHILRRDLNEPDLPARYRFADPIDPRIFSLLQDWVAQIVER
jgi:hypothetical protein